MSLGFGAPLGLFGLFGIPVLIALYAIQNRHKREKITTLFLIDAISDDTSTTRKIDSIRLPISFWLQLLSIILSTTLLARLFYTRLEQSEKVLVLIDGSASMAVFSSKIANALHQIEEKLPVGNTIEWTIISSDTPHKILYQGSDKGKADEGLKNWKPSGTGHPLHRALEIARQSAPYTRLAAVITDHKEAKLNDTITVGIGEPRNNVGFSGGNTHGDSEQRTGEVLIRNYSHEPQTRRLTVIQGNQPAIEESITLAPDEIRRLSRTLNSNDGDIRLRLEPDDFPLDDYFPMVIPQIRTVRWQFQNGRELLKQIYQLINRFPNLEEVNEQPALQIRAVHESELSEMNSGFPQIQWIIFENPSDIALSHRVNGAVAVNHPLVRSLRFASLLVPATSITIPEHDEVLVWQNNNPVISLGGTRETPILRILFDIRYSNATRLPAFIILIHRFLDDLRSRIIAHEARNVDTSQLVSVPLPKIEGKKTVQITTATSSRSINVDSSAGKTIIKSPSEPGFFDILVDGKSVLHGAASFQDSREADLSKAESFFTMGEQKLEPVPAGNALQETIIRSEFEEFTPMLIILTSLTILLSWLYSAPPETSARTSGEKKRP